MKYLWININHYWTKYEHETCFCKRRRFILKLKATLSEDTDAACEVQQLPSRIESEKPTQRQSCCFCLNNQFTNKHIFFSNTQEPLSPNIEHTDITLWPSINTKTTLTASNTHLNGNDWHIKWWGNNQEDISSLPGICLSVPKHFLD